MAFTILFLECKYMSFVSYNLMFLSVFYWICETCILECIVWNLCVYEIFLIMSLLFWSIVSVKEREMMMKFHRKFYFYLLSQDVYLECYISVALLILRRVVSKTVSVKLIIKCKSRQRNEPANYFLVRAGQWKVRWEGRRKAGGPEEARHQGLSPPLFYQAATTVEASFSPWFQPDQEFHQGSNFCQKAWAARSTNPVFSIYPSKLQGCSAFL